MQWKTQKENYLLLLTLKDGIVIRKKRKKCIKLRKGCSQHHINLSLHLLLTSFLSFWIIFFFHWCSTLNNCVRFWWTSKNNNDELRWLFSSSVEFSICPSLFPGCLSFISNNSHAIDMMDTIMSLREKTWNDALFGATYLISDWSTCTTETLLEDIVKRERKRGNRETNLLWSDLIRNDPPKISFVDDRSLTWIELLTWLLNDNRMEFVQDVNGEKYSKCYFCSLSLSLALFW